MAKLVFEMNQSLDGYVDHLEFRPSPALFRHFIEQVRGPWELSFSFIGAGDCLQRLAARHPESPIRIHGATELQCP
jgi:hypothetical protein